MTPPSSHGAPAKASLVNPRHAVITEIPARSAMVWAGSGAMVASWVTGLVCATAPVGWPPFSSGRFWASLRAVSAPIRFWAAPVRPVRSLVCSSVALCARRVSGPLVYIILSTASPGRRQAVTSSSMSAVHASRSGAAPLTPAMERANRLRWADRLSMREVPSSAVTTRVASKTPSPRVRPRSSAVRTGSSAATIPVPMTATSSSSDMSSG